MRKVASGEVHGATVNVLEESVLSESICFFVLIFFGGPGTFGNKLFVVDD